MRRRGRGKKYGRAGYRIGSRGLERTESVKLTAGHVYAMGASSSPHLIKIDSLSTDHIRYRVLSGGQEAVVQRWIGEDLIASGERTFRGRYGVSAQRWTSMTEAERATQIRKHVPELFGGRR